MLNFKVLILKLLFFLCFFHLKSQQYFFKNYSVENGLPFIQVSCMYQDNQGYLWSGGYGGLSRFDGKQFANFNKKNGLIDAKVNAISGDEENTIFIGTNKGLSVFKNNTFINFNKFNGLKTEYVTSFCKGFHQSVYIGTTKGLFIFSKNKIKEIKKLSEYSINCIFKSDTSALLIGTDQGLVIYGHNTFQLLSEANGLPSNKINSIALFKGKIAIGTTRGLSFLDLSTFKFTNYFIQQGLIDLNITALTNQHNLFLWVGSKSGLLRFDGEQFAYYNVDLSNNANQIGAILNDKEDNVWLGTYSGLFRYRDNSFSTFDKINGPGNSFIFQIFRDTHGDLWVCSESNGIYRYSQNYFKHYNSKHGVTTNTCRSAIEDNRGRLLFGTDNGLLRFENEHFVKIELPVKFKGPVEVLFQDSKKTLWIGGTNGFMSLKGSGNQTQTRFYPIPAKEDFVVYGFCEDEKGNLYIGTYHGGLMQLSMDSLVNVSTKYNLNEDTYFTLRYHSGKVWAATLNGLMIYDTQTHQKELIRVEDGLNSDLVYSIEFAENKQSLWVGTNQGVNKLDLKKYIKEHVIEIKSYGKQEGFVGIECNSNGIWEDKDGTLWFGTVNGLIKHQPFNFKYNLNQNPLIIQRIQLQNEDTLLKENTLLPSYMNAIAFYYRGICFTHPDKVLYQKKLQGLEKEWSAPSAEDYSKYANLAPGKYIFKVRSCNNEGIWNSKETEFHFEIERPFYKRWWFISLSFLAAFSLVYIVFIFRIYKIKKKQRKEFERKVEMSRIELKALRAQMNPHFIFNSLNSIQHYIFHSKSEEAIKYLSKFAKLIRTILNNSDKLTVTVGEDLESLKLYIELEQMRFENKFEYEIVVDSNVDIDYDIMPPLLMQPYVENAILHGLNPKPEKGKLTIRLHFKNNFLICTITDNGIGREKSSEIKRHMPLQKHRSVGMKITEERLKILNEINDSKLSVSITDLKNINNEAAGTQVELFIPING